MLLRPKAALRGSPHCRAGPRFAEAPRRPDVFGGGGRYFVRVRFVLATSAAGRGCRRGAATCRDPMYSEAAIRRCCCCATFTQGLRPGVWPWGVLPTRARALCVLTVVCCVFAVSRVARVSCGLCAPGGVWADSEFWFARVLVSCILVVSNAPVLAVGTVTCMCRTSSERLRRLKPPLYF